MSFDYLSIKLKSLSYLSNEELSKFLLNTVFLKNWLVKMQNENASAQVGALHKRRQVIFRFLPPPPCVMP